MPIKRIPLFGSLVNRNANPDSFQDKDQRFINCYPEFVKNEVTRSITAYLNKRLGFTSANLASALFLGTTGCCMWTGHTDTVSPTVFSFANFAGTDVEIWLNGTSSSQVGATFTNATSCQSITETTISGTPNLVAVLRLAGVDTFWFFPLGGAWTQITDLEFPNNQTPALVSAGEPAFLDGYMFIMCTNGQIWNSDLNSLSAWSAANFITASAMPDGGVAAVRYKNLIAGFGKFSVEFFENAGNASGSPLRRIASATIRVGAIPFSGYRTVVPIGDTIYWIGMNSESSQKGVFRLNGFQAERVSTSFTDKLLGENQITGIIGSCAMHGLTHIFFSTAAVDPIPVFCPDTGEWWLASFGGGLYPAAISGNAAAGAKFVDLFVARKVYTASTSSYQDDGVAFTMTARFGATDGGSQNRKMDLRADLACDVQASGTTTLARSSNDFASMTTIGTFDNTAQRKRVHRLGSYVGSAGYQISTSDNTPWRGQFLDLEQEICSI